MPQEGQLGMEEKVRTVEECLSEVAIRTIDKRKNGNVYWELSIIYTT